MGQKNKNKKKPENDQLTGHFQKVFVVVFLISPEQTVKQVM